MLIKWLTLAASLRLLLSQELKIDSLAGGLAASLVNLQPCGCDCCQALRRLPSEEVKLVDGDTSRWKCGRPSNVEGTTTCSGTCQASSSDTVLTAAQGQGEMDYDRYCLFKCKPTAPVSLGSICARLSVSDTQQVSADDGNGFDAALGSNVLEDVTAAVASGSAGPATPAVAALAGPARRQIQTQEETIAKTEKLKAEVKYDYRKVISERLRAEAGASMSHGAASGERVRANLYSVKRNALITKNINDAVAPMEASIEEAISAVDANKTQAEEAVHSTAKVLSEAERLAATFRDQMSGLAVQAVRTQAVAAAEEEAKSWAQVRDFDKPAFWSTVLAVRAADPYMAAMTTAVQRSSEYDGYARTLMKQAVGVQKQAQTLSTQANALEATGDKIGATSERLQVRNLLSRASGLETQAKGFWKTADDTRKTIPKWQQAGVQAAQRTAWEYKSLHASMSSQLQTATSGRLQR